MIPTIFFQSLGCPKNLVDTEVMLGISRQGGFKAVSSPEEAEVIVVNTCSFVNDSKKESIDAILEAADHKISGNCKKLIVTGCLPQRYKADLKVSFPEVDAFVGTGQYANLLDFVNGKKEEELGFKNPRYIHSEHTPRINSQPSHRAYLKISEGCIKNCAFCIIPKIRGTLRSRSVSSLVEEARRLVDDGVIELNLIGQDLTDYGIDLRDGSSLVSLLEALTKIPSLRWIRLLYVYPDDLSDELLDLIATEEKICSYLDMPIQHIEDRMLHLMNRKVTGDQIRYRLERMRKKVPGIFLRSTLIAGYPGETETEFESLCTFIKEAEFDHLGVFAYSHEEGTTSFSLPEQLPQEVKETRRDTAMALQQKISTKNLRKHVGKTFPVLIEGTSVDSLFLEGRHAGQAPEIDGCVLIRRGDAKKGEIVDVILEEALEYDYIGSCTAALSDETENLLSSSP